MSNRVVGAAALIVVAAGVLTGCGGNARAAPPSALASSTPPSSPTSSPSSSACPGETGGPELLLHGRRGTSVDAVVRGAGRADAVVVLHEAGSGLCNAWDFAAWLAHHAHVQVVLFDRCAYGATQCPKAIGAGAARIAATTQPEIDYARAHGARRVTLLGASSGASDAVQAASAVHGVDAVVALSADMTDTDVSATHFDRDRRPTLMAYAPEDGYCPPEVEHRWFRRIPATTKRLAVTSPAGMHGWDLVMDSAGHPLPLAHRVVDWLHGHYR